LKRKPLTQAQARRNMIVYLKNIAGFKMDYFKGMKYDEIRPLFEKHYNYNQAFLDEVSEGVKVSETEVRLEKDVKVESSKREGESLEQKIAKKQKMKEETKELKKHLQIVTDDDDDVYTDATPLASKIPIVDYKIHTEINRPYFKIIRVDGNHMFIQLIINHQLGDMAHYKEIFDTLSLTKKVFSNMKRVGTGFSREVTPLSDNMLVQARKEVAEQNLPSHSNDPLPSGEDSLKLKELMDLCANLSNKVLELESEVIDIKSTYQERIKKLEGRVERLEEENRVLKELKSVYSTDDVDEPVMEKGKSSKQGRKIANIDADVLNIMDANEEEPADVEEVLEVVKAAKEGESLEKEIEKKRKMEEETEELKKHLQIVTDDDDDDAYTFATPLASKTPIVDYKIHTEINRPYFKIIRTDGNHMLFISLSTILKNFDREDLESLWIIIRDRFEKIKPKNYSDEYLLNTLKIMFEKPNVEASVWKDQRGRYGLAKVKSWKFIESCGVHCITFLST
nr:hypothetical protein [Tanacetum cinerariifolium]